MDKKLDLEKIRQINIDYYRRMYRKGNIFEKGHAQTWLIKLGAM